MKIKKSELESIIGKIQNHVDYTGKKFFVEFKNTITFYDTNWSGGTKNQYIGIDLNSLNSKSFNAPAPWFNPVENSTIELPEGKAILKHTFFCGHDLGLTLYVNSIYEPKFLTKGIK